MGLGHYLAGVCAIHGLSWEVILRGVKPDCLGLNFNIQGLETFELRASSFHHNLSKIEKNARGLVGSCSKAVEYANNRSGVGLYIGA